MSPELAHSEVAARLIEVRSGGGAD